MQDRGQDLYLGTRPSASGRDGITLGHRREMAIPHLRFAINPPRPGTAVEAENAATKTGCSGKELLTLEDPIQRIPRAPIADGSPCHQPAGNSIQRCKKRGGGTTGFIARLSMVATVHKSISNQGPMQSVSCFTFVDVALDVAPAPPPVQPPVCLRLRPWRVPLGARS